MKIFSKSFSVILLAVTTFTHFEQTMQTPSKNREFIERIVCRTYPGSKVTHFRSVIKYIDRDHMKVDMSVNLSRPVNDAWVHVEPYFKYNTYQRIAGYIWENICDWMSGKEPKSTNFGHVCPYNGHLYFKVNNLSVQDFAFPQIVPAGRYRLDVNVTEADRTKVLGGCVLYVSVSDHRVEIV